VELVLSGEKIRRFIDNYSKFVAKQASGGLSEVGEIITFAFFIRRKSTNVSEKRENEQEHPACVD